MFHSRNMCFFECVDVSFKLHIVVAGIINMIRNLFSLSQGPLLRLNLYVYMKVFFIIIFDFSFSIPFFWRTRVTSLYCLFIKRNSFKLILSLSYSDGMILLDLVTSMSSSVQRKFSSLSESLLTSVNSANVGLLICMNTFMLFTILVESKSLITIFAREWFVFWMNVVMSSKRKLCSKDILANFTLKSLLKSHLI